MKFGIVLNDAGVTGEATMNPDFQLHEECINVVPQRSATARQSGTCCRL